MTDFKTCPFCLEDIPVKAIKCRYCESMVNDTPQTAAEVSQPAGSAAAEKRKKQAPPQQAVGYQAGPEKRKGKRFLLPLVVVAVLLLLLLGGGGGYWFLLHDAEAPVAEGVESDDVLGSWKGTSGDEEVFFEFRPNEMVRIAVPSEEYWFETEYQVVQDGENSYLELYHSGNDEWERIAKVASRNADELTVTDKWDDIVFELESVTGSEFREVIGDLRLER